MRLRARAAVTIERPRTEVYDHAVANDTLARSAARFGPIPAITHVAFAPGATLTAGARRMVSLSDGSVIEEEVLEADRPRVHRYRWVRSLRPPFSLLVRSGEACWTFSDAGDRATDVECVYLFELRSILIGPIAAPVILLFRAWMQRMLDRIRADLTADRR